MDGAREVRAMVLASLPVPPMPLMVSRRLEDEHGTTMSSDNVASSFDVVAHLLNLAASTGNHSLNQSRAIRQHKVHDALLKEIDSVPDLDCQAGLDAAWVAFARFTTDYIGCFMAASSARQDTRFCDPAQVPLGCPVHLQAAGHALAHDELFGPVAHGGVAPDYHSMGYTALVHRAAWRLRDPTPVGPTPVPA